MSFKGSLESLNITNILQMISLEKKTGLLQVEQGETFISISLSDGQVTYAERKGSKDIDRLKYTLAGNRIIPKDRVLRAIKENKTTLDSIWVILSKYASREILRELLERQIKDCLFLALQWETGTYQFDLTDEHSIPEEVRESNVPEEIKVSIGVDSILMEGCRIADEWKVLAKTFPQGGSTIRQGKNKQEGKTENEKLILSYLKEGTSVEILSNVSRLGEFETCEAIDALLKRKALRITGKEGGEEKKKEKQPLGFLLKRSAGMLVPALALLVVLLGIFVQIAGLEHSLFNRKKEMDYVFKETSRSHLDLIFSRLQLYTALHDKYPESLSLLVQAGLLKEKDIYDQWGKPIRYFIKENNFFLYSTGRKGDAKISDVALEK